MSLHRIKVNKHAFSLSADSRWFITFQINCRKLLGTFRCMEFCVKFENVFGDRKSRRNEEDIARGKERNLIISSEPRLQPCYPHREEVAGSFSLDLLLSPDSSTLLLFSTLPEFALSMEPSLSSTATFDGTPGLLI